ncbi:MAG: T9SS type A sorting domain-containing protein [bacterium]|nr:T9SS type A sorting domain-containing protein [bacterium]
MQQATEVSLVVYDLAGRQVQTLVQGPMESGRHVVSWQPKNQASGTYFYKLQTNGEIQVKKCVLVK